MIDFEEPLSLGFIYKSIILNFKIWFLGFLLSKLWWLFLGFIYRSITFVFVFEFLNCWVLLFLILYVLLISRVLELFHVMLSCCLEFPSSWILLSFGKSWSSWFILCFVEFWCVGFQSSWVLLCCTMNHFVLHLFCIWCCFLKIEWIWEHLSLLLKD